MTKMKSERRGYEVTEKRSVFNKDTKFRRVAGGKL